MYKVESDTGKSLISYNINDIWNFIVTNGALRIRKNHILISNDDFLNVFLKQTKDWNRYYSAYSKLKPSITLKNKIL